MLLDALQPYWRITAYLLPIVIIYLCCTRIKVSIEKKGLYSCGMIAIYYFVFRQNPWFLLLAITSFSVLAILSLIEKKQEKST